MEVNIAKNRLMKQRRTVEFMQINGKERMMELDFLDEAIKSAHAEQNRKNVFNS